jgi:hypothetical protein
MLVFGNMQYRKNRLFSYIRTHMSRKGLSRISGLEPSDLFLNFDADEVPKEEAVLFLKMYQGYPMPIRKGRTRFTTTYFTQPYYMMFVVKWD